jgi:hypothetical protein
MRFSVLSGAVLGAFLLSISGSEASAANALKRPAPVTRSAIHPGLLREFALTALQHLKGPAQRPFLQLLKTLPPAKQVGVTISTKATKNMQCSGGTCTPTAAVAVLNVGQLTNMLVDQTVTISTSAQAPDIFVNAPFSWTSANGLTLQAIGSIVVNKSVQDAGPAPLNLQYNVTGAGGALSFGAKGHISFLSTGNPLTINGQGYILANNIQLLAQLIARNPNGSFALSANYNARADGKYRQSPINVTLTGNLNGLGNILSNLKVESTGEGSNGGVVVATGPNANIDYLRVQNAHIAFNPFAASCVGGLVGTNNGILSGVSFNGTVSAFSQGDYAVAGGISCDNAGTIENSMASGPVDANSTVEFARAGGIAGQNEGLVDLSGASDTVSAEGNGSDQGDCSIAAGGLYGYDGGLGTNSFSTGDVTAKDIAINNACAGGLTAITTGSITSSSAAGSATAYAGSNPGWIAGGLVGLAFAGTIKNSSASGAASAENSGGLVGANFDTIESSSATGAVSGPNGAYVGGLMGYWQSDNGSTVANSTSYGTVTNGGSGLVGGFVGEDATPGNFSNDGWCTTSSGITDPSQGAGNIPNDPGIAPFTC